MRVLIAVLALVFASVSWGAPAPMLKEYLIKNNDCDALRNDLQSVAEMKDSGIPQAMAMGIILSPKLLETVRYRARVSTILTLVSSIYKLPEGSPAIGLIGSFYTNCLGSVGKVWYYTE